VVQASLKLVLEPIFEADFLPYSYGFRPNRRTHDAVAQTRQLAARSYEWVVEGDITACFDEISHSALMDRVRGRVGDRRVLALVKAFLKAGVLTEDRTTRDTDVGTPQGGILSPLLANVALGVLDEHIERMWPSTWYGRSKRRRQGLANYRIIRYADDFLIMVSGDRSHAEVIRDDVAEVLATIGLRLSVEKTRITHIDEGLDFLGWRIRRQRKRGTNIKHIYTYPAKKAVLAITRKVKMICWQDLSQPLAALIHRLNPVLRGWCSHFRPGVSSAAFNYLRATVWRQVFAWLRRKHRGVTWKRLRRLYCGGGWWPADGEVKLFNPAAVRTTRYRFRGNSIPSPWPTTP
jgi:RNA-directed DNA polymerase